MRLPPGNEHPVDERAEQPTRLSCLLPFCLAIVATSHAADDPCRWVYVLRGLHKDQHVEDTRGIVNTAAQHGLNGMVLAAGLDRLDRQPARYLERLESVKQLCADRHIEITPIAFSAAERSAVKMALTSRVGR